MYLASSCFIGAFLAFCITIGSLAGCSMKSVLPGSQGQSVNATQETQAPAGTGSIEQAAGQTSAGSIPGGSSGSVQDGNAGSVPEGNGGADGSIGINGAGPLDPASDPSGNMVQPVSSEPAFTLPYDKSDPAEMASAHNWICSDLVENSKKLDGLTETEDFHAAVNRDWLSSNSIPSGYVSYDAFSERQLEVDAELLEILESDDTFSDPYIAHCQRLVRDYYKMWLDWDARDKAGMTPLADILEPLQNVSSLDQMTQYLSDPLTTIEALPLCSSFTAANPNDASSIAVYISPPSLTFQDAMYYSQLDPDSWKTQPRYMYAAGYMLERLGYSKEERDTVLKQSYEFECEMAAHMMTTEEQNAEDSSIRTNNPRTLQEAGEFSFDRHAGRRRSCCFQCIHPSAARLAGCHEQSL